MRTTHRGATIGAGLVVAAVLCLGLGPIAAAEPKGTQDGPPIRSSRASTCSTSNRSRSTSARSALTQDGFRVTGTPQDEETANYLADRMDAIGLEDVVGRVAHHRRLAVHRRIRDGEGRRPRSDVPRLLARRRPRHSVGGVSGRDRAGGVRDGSRVRRAGCRGQDRVRLVGLRQPRHLAELHRVRGARPRRGGSHHRVGAGQRVVRRGRWTRARRKRRRMQHNRVRPVGRDQPAERPRACGRARRRHREGLRLVGG